VTDVKASRLGISESATLALALIVTMALAGIAIVFFQSYAQSASNAARAEAASQIERMSEEVSIVYWIGSRLMLKNDGEKPVTIQRIFTDSGIIEQTVTIQPGEKKILTVPQSDLLVLQTSGGSIIKLKNPQPQAGGGVSGGLEITEAQATAVGTNAQIKITVKNTSRPGDIQYKLEHSWRERQDLCCSEELAPKPGRGSPRHNSTTNIRVWYTVLC